MTDDVKDISLPSNEEPITSWSDFIGKIPPDSPVTIGLGPCHVLEGHVWKKSYGVSLVDAALWCEGCGGERQYAASTGGIEFFTKILSIDRFITYTCRNCVRSVRVFAVRLTVTEPDAPTAVAQKFGEVPPFGPHTPARVITLIGPDRELFLKGRRAELRGLGIGAFAYYRRVVENQTQRLFAEIRAVAVKLGSTRDVLDTLDRAISETQFTKAVALVKDAIPERLLLNGHNPLTLLHDALSSELHAGTDEDALAVARSIREVLTEIAVRMSEVLQERSELDQAVATLLAKRSGRDRDPKLTT